jgi:predicted nucleotidyltransferase component of viral defense system
MAAATDLSLAPEVVEKDYVLGWMLAGIYADPRLARSWVFKGGTCLKKCFFETYRFSEDLDFTLLDPSQIDETFLKSAFADVSRWVLDRSGVEIPIDQVRFEVYRNKRNGLSCEGRLYYRGPMQRGGSLQRVKLDLTVDEKVVLPVVERRVGHPYGDRPEDGIMARCYSFEEVLAEKTRALGERTRPRDLFDVINLFRTDEYRPPAAVVADVLRQKCEFKKIAIPTQAAIAHSETELRGDWQAMLGHQLPALPPFESYWAALPDFFKWLATGVIPAPLQSAPYSSAGAIYRPALGELRALGIRGSNHLELIRFAAANRLCVELGYHGTVRLIEPYSLRRTSEGNVLLLAVRAIEGAIRSYRVDEIQAAHATSQTFAPRYAVELSTTELSIPPLVRAEPSSPKLGGTFGRGVGQRFSPAARTGPVYVYECGLCGRKFRHATRDSHLRPHKAPEGRNCSGRTGRYVDTKR